MKKLLKKLRHKAILYVFNYYFGHLVYGFETPDTKLAKMNETELGMYYRAVTDWVNSDAYAVEDKGELEDAYAKLATEAPSEDIIAAYRLVMLRLKNKDIRLRTKVAEYMAVQATRKQSSIIK